MRALAIIAATGLGALAVGPSPAYPGPATAESVITLLEQPAWSPLGADVVLRLNVVNTAPGMEVRAVIHTNVQSRIGYERTLQGERLGSQIATTSTPLDALPTSADGGRLFTIPLQDPAAPRDSNRVRITLPRSAAAGVYPVEIELRDPETGDSHAGFITHLVATSPAANSEPIAEPLRLSWVWHIADDPAIRANGMPSPSFIAAVSPFGRLATIADLLKAARGVPLVLAPGPETVSSWQLSGSDDRAIADGIDAVRSSAQLNQVLAGSYVPINGPSLLAAGLEADAVTELRVGTATLNATLNTVVSPRTVNASPLDAAFLEKLFLNGVEKLVLSPKQLLEPDVVARFTPALPFAVESNGRTFTAVTTSPELRALLATDGSPALRAQNLLAGLAVVALEQPNLARGVVLDTARRWNPDPEVIEPVLDGLLSNPLIEAVSLDDLLAAVPPEETEDGPVVRRIAPVTSDSPSVDPTAFLATSARLNGLASMVGAADPSVEKGRESLLTSLTSAWTGGVGRKQAAARLVDVDTSIDAVTAKVSTPAARSVTVTSRRAGIPVSILNETGRDVRVRLRLKSNKLKFPDGNDRVLTLAPDNTTVHFAVESRASGTFPLGVVLTSEDGALSLGRARYTVRSTVVSGVGVIITISAILFLAFWWITHWRRSRRATTTVTVST